METRWLEDFVSLAETRSFSRSAELRNVTQPAFSRRIRALEAWLGADLIDRTCYPTRLTGAGEVFREQALEMLGQLEHARGLVAGRRRARQITVDFAVPHTLSLTFVPKWLKSVEGAFGPIRVRLMALNVHDAVMAMVEGGCDLLLCYHHPGQPVQLDAQRYDMLVLGEESLHPYSACDPSGNPVYLLPGTPHHPLPFLSYSSNAYFGRMVDLIFSSSPGLQLEKRYETDMAEGLKMMALERHGIAFLPASSVIREVEQGLLARADAPEKPLQIRMEIRLYRERPSEQRPGKSIVDRLWRQMLRDA